MMTAEEYIKSKLGFNSDVKIHQLDVSTSGWISMMEEYSIQKAKYHCEAQLKSILEDVNLVGDNAHNSDRPLTYVDSAYVVDQNGPDYIYTVNRESIINAYPLENIK